MKFCYLDESGMGSEPILVMAGIIVDAQRMHRTKEAWSDFLNYLSSSIGKKVNEFHSGNFYRGSGAWGKIDGAERAKVISAILAWIDQRKHHITFSAIHKESFNNCKGDFDGISTPWNAAAVHCVLGLQKHQQQGGNKGHTVLVFDKAKGEIGFTKLVLDPPVWTQSFHSKRSVPSPLDQIVDVPFFADSEHALLIQVADTVSYILRSYADLVEGIAAEKYRGEQDRLQGWVGQILKRSIPQAMRYPARARCHAAQRFWDIAPECLRK